MDLAGYCFYCNGQARQFEIADTGLKYFFTSQAPSIFAAIMQKRIGIIGAGPAGLTAAYLLAKAGQAVTVFESDPKYVGGISRTENYKGYLFDIGGHRFFSKSKEVEDFWTEILSDDMLDRPRSSRIWNARIHG